MSRKNTLDPSIRRQLLLWLMVPMSGVWVITTAVACWFGADSSRALFDQQLLDSADSVAARIDVRQDKVVAPLPASARAIIERGIDKFYFGVMDENGKALAKDGDIVTDGTLPWPMEINEAYFGNGAVNGIPVRVVRTFIIDPETDRPLVLEAAETIHGREQFSNKILINILLSELLVIVIGAIAVDFGISRGLLSLNVLRGAIAERTPSDLRGVSLQDVPVEVMPLVNAINDLLDRLRLEIESQKRFVANAAHQLRTPVTGMKTYLALARRKATSDDQRMLLTQFEEGVNRLAHLINRLLSLAKAEPSGRRDNRTNIDMNEVVTEAMSALVQEALDKDIELGFEASPQPAIIKGSAEELHELVTNIVENAILYTPKGGHVSVRLSNTDDVTLAVEDNGPGIPVGERQNVFDRFYRLLGTDVNGSGLGLSIVKEIANAHGAAVSIDTGAEGVGTCVTVKLPAVH